MTMALLASLSGTVAAGTQVDWDAALRGLSPLSVGLSAPAPQRMAGEVSRSLTTTEAERLAAADVLAQMQTPAVELAGRDPEAYRQSLIRAMDGLNAIAHQQKMSDEQFEGVRSYVQQAVQQAPAEVLQRAAGLGVLPAPAGLGENQREIEVLYRVPSVDVRAQADGFVESLFPPGEIRQRLAGFDAMQAWLDGPSHELAGRLLQPQVVGKEGSHGELAALRQVLAYDRTANNRLNHGWASAAMGALSQGGVDSVENYFRRLGQQHGQDMSDWSFPAELRAALPPPLPADHGINWDVVDRRRRGA